MTQDRSSRMAIAQGVPVEPSLEPPRWQFPRWLLIVYLVIALAFWASFFLMLVRWLHG